MGKVRTAKAWSWVAMSGRLSSQTTTTKVSWLQAPVRIIRESDYRAMVRELNQLRAFKEKMEASNG